MLAQTGLGCIVFIAMTALPRPAIAGAFCIEGSTCWCEGHVPLEQWIWFPVWYVPSDQSECPEPLSAAFRIEGVQDDNPVYGPDQRWSQPFYGVLRGAVVVTNARP